MTSEGKRQEGRRQRETYGEKVSLYLQGGLLAAVAVNYGKEPLGALLAKGNLRDLGILRGSKKKH